MPQGANVFALYSKKIFFAMIKNENVYHSQRFKKNIFKKTGDFKAFRNCIKYKAKVGTVFAIKTTVEL